MLEGSYTAMQRVATCCNKTVLKPVHTNATPWNFLGEWLRDDACCKELLGKSLVWFWLNINIFCNAEIHICNCVVQYNF